jgi:hypothetical protein
MGMADMTIMDIDILIETAMAIDCENGIEPFFKLGALTNRTPPDKR